MESRPVLSNDARPEVFEIAAETKVIRVSGLEYRIVYRLCLPLMTPGHAIGFNGIQQFVQAVQKRQGEILSAAMSVSGHRDPERICRSWREVHLNAAGFIGYALLCRKVWRCHGCPSFR